MLWKRRWLLPLMLLSLTISVSASDSLPLQWPEEPDFEYTAEDYQETTVQVGSLRQALWYLKMYKLCREAYYEAVRLATVEERAFARQIEDLTRTKTFLVVTLVTSVAVNVLLSLVSAFR